MILGGDELGHTQNGNNNTYCQDNELSWLKWDLDQAQQDFLAFVKKVSQVWATQPVFQRRKFFKGRALRGSDIKDISFFTPSGQEMSDQDWNNNGARCMGVRLAGDVIDEETDQGEPIVGETLLLLLNAHHEPLPFTLPATKTEHHWHRMLDTADDQGDLLVLEGGNQYTLKERSFALLSAREPAAVTPNVVAPTNEGR
jgi:glycogen operon protein